MDLLHAFLDKHHKIDDILSFRIVGVDDEVGMELGYLSTPDTGAFKTYLFYQLPDRTTFGVLEHTTRIGNGQGLALLAPGKPRLHLRPYP